MKKLLVILSTLLMGDTSAQNNIIDFRIYRTECFSVLTWTTPKNLEDMMFEVEKSYDGYDFNKIGEASYSGIYYQFKTYEYTDVDTTSAATYYRLRLIKTNHQEITFADRVLKVN